jgi:SAM-dependent methyltransferase
MRIRPVMTALLVAAALGATGLSAQRPTHGRLFPPDLFPPEDLGILESPDRDDWQQPDRIMDALRIRDGSRVADLGAGGGWFTIRLARRVGPNGRVYAHDIQPEMIESMRPSSRSAWPSATSNCSAAALNRSSRLC